MSNTTFNVPINSVSFGQVSTALLREAYKREMSPLIFPIGGGIDLSSQSGFEGKNDKDKSSPDAPFFEWLQTGIDRAPKEHLRDDWTLKLWHLNGGLDSFSKSHLLMTFYELDSPTPAELNVLKNVKVAVSSSYTKQVFEEHGCECHFVPLGFDSHNFSVKKKKYFNDDRVTFNLCGKFEHRKHHLKSLRTWVNEFGDNPKYHLQCSLYNSFLSPEQNNTLIMRALEGKRFSNVTFLNQMPTNSQYNDYLNSSDVIIGMSGGEGWGLPEFQSACLGKHAVILNAHAYKDWANPENSVLVEPSGKIPSTDGIFFKKGTPFNQGEFFDWKEEDFKAACYEAIKRARNNRVNENGLKLAEEFTYSNTLDGLLGLM